jgi:hypothetical protein
MASEKRFSDILLRQLIDLPYYGGINFPLEYVVHEIETLEGIREKSQTEPANQFKGNILKGFWKKHFFVPSYSLGQNVINHWKLGQSSSEKFKSKYLELAKPYKNLENPSDKVLRKLSAQIAEAIMKPISESKKTGEYIIFCKYRGKNYYLCLGAHGTDEKIRKDITTCVTEFPFLDGMLNPS